MSTYMKFKYTISNDDESITQTFCTITEIEDNAAFYLIHNIVTNTHNFMISNDLKLSHTKIDKIIDIVSDIKSCDLLIGNYNVAFDISQVDVISKTHFISDGLKSKWKSKCLQIKQRNHKIC